MLLAKDWKEYELLGASDGEKVEKWGQYVLRRPDSQVLWPSSIEKLPIDAIYHRSSTGGGKWEYKKKLPERWTLNYKQLKFYVEPTGFKHTGLFPEQAVNWDWTAKLIAGSRSSAPLKVLNLFAYTGAASSACAAAGAEVVHVDAAKGMNQWAKENAQLNGVENRVRFITEDAKKFVQREIRRGSQYHGIIMDPPVYGRGPNGELWEIEKEIGPLIAECAKLLSKDSLFFIVNCYTASFSHTALQNLIDIEIKNKLKGTVDSGELGIPIKNSSLVLPCGIYARWFQ